jgi:hypothetical protein
LTRKGVIVILIELKKWGGVNSQEGGK